MPTVDEFYRFNSLAPIMHLIILLIFILTQLTSWKVAQYSWLLILVLKIAGLHHYIAILEAAQMLIASSYHQETSELKIGSHSSVNSIHFGTINTSSELSMEGM